MSTRVTRTRRQTYSQPDRTPAADVSLPHLSASQTVRPASETPRKAAPLSARSAGGRGASAGRAKATAKAPAVMEGNLRMKQQPRAFRKAWATRLVRVRGGELAVFKNLHALHPQLSVPLASIAAAVPAHDLEGLSEKNQMRCFAVEFVEATGREPLYFITTSVRDQRQWVAAVNAWVAYARVHAQATAEADPEHVADLVAQGVDIDKLNPALRAKVTATLQTHKWEEYYTWVDEFGVEHEVHADDIDTSAVKVVDASSRAAPRTARLTASLSSSSTTPMPRVGASATRSRSSSGCPSASSDLSEASAPATPTTAAVPHRPRRTKSTDAAIATAAAASSSSSDSDSDSDSYSDSYSSYSSSADRPGGVCESLASYSSYDEVWEEWDEWESVSDDSVVHGTAYVARLLGEHPHAAYKVHGGDATERMRAVYRLVDEVARVRYGATAEPARADAGRVVKARIHGDPLFVPVVLSDMAASTYAGVVGAVLAAVNDEAEANGFDTVWSSDDVFALVRVDGPDRVRVTQRTITMLRAGDRLELVLADSALAAHYTGSSRGHGRGHHHHHHHHHHRHGGGDGAAVERPEGYYRDLWRSIVHKGTWMRLSSWRPSASQRWAQVARAAWKAVAATAWHEISSALGESLGGVDDGPAADPAAAALEKKMLADAFGADASPSTAGASPLDDHALADARWHEVFAKLESSITGKKKVKPGTGLYKASFIDKEYEPKPWVDLHHSKWGEVYTLLKLAKDTSGLPHSVSDSDDDDADAASDDRIVLHDAHEYGEHHLMPSGSGADDDDELAGIHSDHSDGYFSLVHHVFTEGDLHDPEADGDLRILSPEERAEAERVLERWSRPWHRVALSAFASALTRRPVVTLRPGSKWAILRELGAAALVARLGGGKGKEVVSDDTDASTDSGDAAVANAASAAVASGSDSGSGSDSADSSSS